MSDGDLLYDLALSCGGELTNRNRDRMIDLLTAYKKALFESAYSAGYAARDKLSCANCGDGGKLEPVEKHKYCPECGSSAIEHTTAGYHSVDRNRASCRCGWKGIVNDLTEEPIDK